MDFNWNEGVELYSKIIVGGTGILAVILRLRNYFSESRKKQSIKRDLEILALAEKSGLKQAGLIRDRIKDEIENSYDVELKSESGITNFVTGLIVFLGFGLWSIDLFKKAYPDFNPWTILTLFSSVTGFSMLLFDSRKTVKTKPFISIGIYDKTNLQFATVIFLVCGLILSYLIISSDHFTFWIFFNGLFCFLAISTFFRSIKRIH